MVCIMSYEMCSLDANMKLIIYVNDREYTTTCTSKLGIYETSRLGEAETTQHFPYSDNAE